MQPVVERRKVLLTPVLGLVVAVLAIVFFEITGKPSSYVLFSGQSALPTLISMRRHGRRVRWWRSCSARPPRTASR